MGDVSDSQESAHVHHCATLTSECFARGYCECACGARYYEDGKGWEIKVWSDPVQQGTKMTTSRTARTRDLELTPAAARDLIDGLQRLANCEAIAEYEPGYINKEFTARQRIARGLLDRNMARLTRIAAGETND